MYPPNGRPDDMDHIMDGIWIGSHYVLKSANTLNARGVKNVINTAIEFITEDPHLINWEDLQRNGIEVHNTYWDDTMTQPIFPSASLEIAVKKMDEVLRAGKPILVNCAMGKSRSTSLVIAYLLARRGMTYDQALATCKKSRPQVQPNQNFERQLRQLEASLRSAFAAANMNSSPMAPPQSPAPTTPSTAPLSPRNMMPSMMRQNNPSSPHSSVMGNISPLAHRSMSPSRPSGASPFAPLPPSPSARVGQTPQMPSRSPSSPSFNASLNMNNNGFNGMNGTNGYGLTSPSTFNSPVGLNGTNFGGMNGSGYNPYNSMYGGMNGLPSPHSNNKLGTPYHNKNGPYGMPSPFGSGGMGYSPYKPNDNMGLWNHNHNHNHRRPGSDMNASPLRRRLSI